MNIALSIDIGGTTTKLASVSRKGQLLEKQILSTISPTSEKQYFKSLFFSISTILGNLKYDYRLEGIGVGAPGCSPDKGVIGSAANLPFLAEARVVEILEQQYGVPVMLIKDGNAAALGEGLFGAAKGMKNYVLITLGTGLGCGIVVNGDVVSGANGQAGEMGHTIVKKNGRDCGCGRRGCLETYVSATGIKRTLFKLLGTSNKASRLRTVSYEDVTPKMIYDAACDGDEAAVKAFDYTGKKLGEKLADLVAFFEPEAIFLAGGLAEAGKLLFEPVKLSMERNILDMYKKQVKVLPSALKINEAALLGAASLVWQQPKLENS